MTMSRNLNPLIIAVVAASAALAPLGCASTGSEGRASSGGATHGILVNRDRQGVAIMGYDPVAYFTDSRPVKGSSQFASMHGGATYHFVSQDHKRMFDADPARYAPQFGGYCAYAASINKVSPIDPNFWEIIDGRLILQHNQKAWDLWHKDARGSLAKADVNWPGLVARKGT